MNVDIEKLKHAGVIAKNAVVFARALIKPGMPLLEIAEAIEHHIKETGKVYNAKPAFPVNLSINEQAAHVTPSHNETQTAHGLLKVDIGVHISGWIADTAFSLDLENNEENKQLIAAAEAALQAATSIIKKDVTLHDIGAAIEQAITSNGFLPIRNLSGHSLEPYKLHAGITIPNVKSPQRISLSTGIYAVEPFATSGFGTVKDSKPSGIYSLEGRGNVRDLFARQVLACIKEEYQTLPFCSRWLVKRFGTRSLLALQRIEEAKLLHHYKQLIEAGKGNVAQAEHTVVITEKEVIVTTA